MQAITTKYSPMTSRNNARIHAVAQAGSLFHPFDDDVSENRNHQLAAMALAKKLDWDGLWVKGVTKQGLIVWVNASEPHQVDVFHLAPGQLKHVKEAAGNVFLPQR